MKKLTAILTCAAALLLPACSATDATAPDHDTLYSYSPVSKSETEKLRCAALSATAQHWR